jgi:hypothetical protein
VQHLQLGGKGATASGHCQRSSGIFCMRYCAHCPGHVPCSECYARYETTRIVPTGANPEELLLACEGYYNHIANNLDHNAFYDKVVLPEDAAEEECHQKEVQAKADDRNVEASSDFSWSRSDKGEATKADDVPKANTALRVFNSLSSLNFC